MKERHILFSGEMVRAILENRKSQTRRIVKPQPASVEYWLHGKLTDDKINGCCSIRDTKGRGWTIDCEKFKPYYGKPGDRLWVKETFMVNPYVSTEYIYRATEKEPLRYHTSHTPWKPSIFMPRKASRITLEITQVRVDRLQDISEADAKAEGVRLNNSTHWATEACDAYKALWESINGNGSWDKNPWVWVIEFKKL